MIAESVKFKGFSCFTEEWAGFETVRPVNVIIGRNNSGKSRLLQLVEDLCAGEIYRSGSSHHCFAILDRSSLAQVFQDGVSGGPLPGDHWGNYGAHFVGERIEWSAERGVAHDLQFQEGSFFNVLGEHQQEGVIHYLSGYLSRNAKHALSGRKYRHLLADRDVRSELASKEIVLFPDGRGATNAIRRFLSSSSPSLPREVIQRDLLDGLNAIFGSDGSFSEIEVQHHDEVTPGHQEESWEVFLSEEHKGLISLSQSGSGLKTVILVLLNLLVIPKVEGKPPDQYVYAFEELENNLHPALLRRLFGYLEDFALKTKATIFLTTHSSVALDLFGSSENAQIIHVAHNGRYATARTIRAHFDRYSVLSELGAKPSDLLQANGVIWVEGPSDRIYLNRWIELLSDGEFREGRHYQCAFYGGALLARTQFTAPLEQNDELVNLLTINSNIAVVLDSDRTSAKGKGAMLKDRALRIAGEVGKIPGSFLWITEAKEIENYLPGEVMQKALKLAACPRSPEKLERFFPSDAKNAPASFLESELHRKSFDKAEVALLAAPHFTVQCLESRFDLAEKVRAIIARIRVWNA